MAEEGPQLPLPSEEARQRLTALGASIMFEKVLTSSDTSGSGRIVIPKGIAEANFPIINDQNGIVICVKDVFNKSWQFRYRFWINNTSRMYLIEGTQELQQRFRLAVGDVLMFSKDAQNGLYICGRKGTKADVSRKAPGKRPAEPTKPKTTKAKPSVDNVSRGEPRSKRAAATAAAAAAAAGAGGGGYGINAGHGNAAIAGGGGMAPGALSYSGMDDRDAHALYTYWNGMSLPARRDGVFRAVPIGAVNGSSDGKVVTQYGYWSAVVTLEGEQYQAFFDSRDAATAALEAALQGETV